MKIKIIQDILLPLINQKKDLNHKDNQKVISKYKKH